MPLVTHYTAFEQKVRAWIAAWRQRSTDAQALTAQAAAVAVGQPLSIRHNQQQEIAGALSSAGKPADGHGAGPSQTDDSEQSMLDARSGDPPL
jgi:hypothetical protein